MNASQPRGRGARWLAALTRDAAPVAGRPASVQVVDASLAGRPARYIAVVPDPSNPFPRARRGEVGLIEGWELAHSVHEVIAVDRAAASKRPIIAVIDVPSQAYGRREEAYGIHLALAAAAGAYAEARLAGHPVIGLIVGKAMSGAFLAHGYQANRLIALDDPEVQVHAMGKESAARVTLRSVQDLEAFAAAVPPMAYDIASYGSLGLLWRTLKIGDADAPNDRDLQAVTTCLAAAEREIRADPARDLSGRSGGPNRQATRDVRERLRREWVAA